MRKDHVRTNRIWVAMIEGSTREVVDDTEVHIHHKHYMIKFFMPELLVLNAEQLQNTAANAAWFYLNGLDKFSTLSGERIINAGDLHDGIIDLIPWKNISFMHEPATLESYKKLGLFGYKREEENKVPVASEPYPMFYME